MSVVLWWLAGTVVVAFFVLSLCRAAKNGDILAGQDDEWPDQLPEVARLSEYRTRRDIRNGLGRAS